MPLSNEELRDLIRPGGESSSLEYKRDRPEASELAKLMAAFANGEGGRILIGVDDSGQVAGFDEPRFEEWVAEIARHKVDPPLTPAVERHNLAGGRVLVVDVPRGPDKPYARVHENRRNYFVRVGTTVREPGTEELQRLFLASGRRFHADEFPVPGTSAADLEGPALYTFAREVHRKDLAALDAATRRAWLTNVGYLQSPEGPASLAGILLFGEAPETLVPESGIVLGRFSGSEVIASALEDRQVFGGRLPALIDNGLKAVLAATASRTRREEGRLVAEPEIPPDVLREALVNAVIHRDYSLKARLVRVLICSDRVEVRSPGRPPNMLTVEQMSAGKASIPRNPLLFTAMSHLGYVQSFGMGVKTILEETARLGRPASLVVEVDETALIFPRLEPAEKPL